MSNLSYQEQTKAKILAKLMEKSNAKEIKYRQMNHKNGLTIIIDPFSSDNGFDFSEYQYIVDIHGNSEMISSQKYEQIMPEYSLLDHK